MRRFSNSIAALFMVTAALPSLAYAIPCNTGISGSCALPLLNQGAADPNWTVQYSGGSGPLITTIPTVFGNAYANRNSSSWLADGPASKWITPGQPENQAELGGQYFYHTAFNGNDGFSGRYSSDNELLGVFLNGILLAGFNLNGPADFNKWTNFSITTGLLASNTLDFVVRNRGGGGIDSAGTVTGFRAEFNAVPAPSVNWLIIAGLGAFYISRRLRSTHINEPRQKLAL